MSQTTGGEGRGVSEFGRIYLHDDDYHSDHDQAKEGSPEHPLRQSFLVLVLCRVLHQMIRLKVTQVRLKLAKTQLSQLSNQVHILGWKFEDRIGRRSL